MLHATFIGNQGLRGSASPVSTATGFVNGRTIFDPTQNPHPLTDHQKFVASDYAGNPYGCAKFVANPPTGGLLDEWVKYNKNFTYLFIYTFLSGTHLQVRPVEGFSRLWLKRRGLAQGCAFWGFSSYCSPFWG